MRKLLFLVMLAIGTSVQAYAHQAFTLVSSEKKTIKQADLTTLEKGQTMGRKGKNTLAFTEKDIRLVIITGPEDDMLSYRIQGVRNPTLVVPSGATLRALFVNVDDDMKHDLRFGHVMGAFTANPDTKETVGSDKLAPVADGVMQAEELVIKASEIGMYKYFCSVGSHAKGGMWGNIAVGVKPGANMKMPMKTTHVHSPDEDKMDNMPGMKPEKKSGEMSDMPGMTNDDKMSNMAGMYRGDDDMKMSSVTNVGDPMEREASGTSWQPDSSPVYATDKSPKGEDAVGMLMLMGTAFVRYTNVGSTRNVSVAGEGNSNRVDAPSMFMLMGSVPTSDKTQWGIHVMLSLDPIFQRGYGYPLLYQTGETYRGQPIHDRQHPHDLFSELAVTYSYKFNEKRSFYLYAGYPGEPALGPPMYLHRASGANMPDAPIGHHWQDSTHITFGVVTGGFSFGRAKIEASAFNGREPDGNRWNFDRPRIDSFSGRLSFNPTKNWALQVSHGYLKDPEESEPEVRILRRTTVSAIYNKKFDDDHNWASTFVWGQNYANGERSNSFLFESNYDFTRNAVFGRLERVQKSGHELVLARALEDTLFPVGAASLGYIRDLIQGKGIDVGLGAMATLNKNSEALATYYGGTTHGGWQVFMRFRPSKSH